MKLYISDLSLYLLAFVWLPFVVWVLWKLARSSRLRGWKKAAGVTVALVLAYVIPLGDVTLYSFSMAAVCQRSGLQIHKTVEVDGYLTDVGDGDILKKRSYKFIETPKREVDGSQYWMHYEIRPDGTISSQRLSQPTADYESVSVGWHMDTENGVMASSYVIRNRSSGDVLAEWNLFNAPFGWLDRALVVRWFGYGGQDGCHGDPAYDFESRVLLPKYN